MRAFTKLRLRLRSVFLRDRAERELDDEIRFHLDSQIAENIAAGLEPREARQAALRALGGVAQIEEACRDERRTAVWDGFIRDLRHGFRLLRQKPGYAAASISVLALGIASSTAIFSSAYSVLLRPLPYPNSGRLMRLWDNFGFPGNLAPVSYPNFRDWRAWNRTFSGLSVFQEGSFILTGAGDPTPLQSVSVSANYFDVLGIRPALGREFRTEDETPGGNAGADSVIISDRLWRNRFGAAPNIVGTRINRDRNVVVGVMPPGFKTFGANDPDIWFTIASAARVRPGMPWPLIEERGISNWNALGRLQPGVSIGQARADMTRVAKLLERSYPGEDPHEGVAIESLQASAAKRSRPMLIALLWAAAALLAIACADASGLALARISARQREVSVRAAIGAGKWRILRQLLAESLVLSGCGALIAIPLASALSRLLAAFLQLDPDAAGISWPALAFAAAFAGLSALVFSLAPAIHALRFDLAHGLREAAANVTASFSQKRLQTALATAQMALAMVLLSACGLLALNILHLQRSDLGFDPNRTFTFPVALPTSRYPQTERARVMGDFLQKLRAIPGVDAASASTQMPFRSFVPRTVLDNVDGKPIPLSDRRGIVYSPITADYFRAVGIPVKRGRAFNAGDTATAPPVVILNEAAAKRYFGGKDPLGRQVTPEMWNGSGSQTQPRTVVGVVGDVALQNAGDRQFETVYWPMAQIPSEGSYWIAIRTPGDPLAVAGAAREMLRGFDRDLPFYQAAPLFSAVNDSFLQPRYNTALVGFFAVLALLLTGAGIYGTIAYAVSERKHEIGIRIALGAGRACVARQFLRGGLAVGIVGATVGLAFTKAAAGVMKSLVFGAAVDEPVAFAVSAAVLLGVAMAAAWIPARRAARVDAMTALRSE